MRAFVYCFALLALPLACASTSPNAEQPRVGTEASAGKAAAARTTPTISFCGQEWPEDTSEIECDNTEDDLALLLQFGALTRLDLRVVSAVDYRALGELKHLQELRLTSSALPSLEPLQSLTHLRVLEIRAAPLESLDGLEHLVQLEELYLEEVPIEELAPLAALPKLRKLELRATRLTDLVPLKHLTQLEALQVSFARVSDVSALSGLTRLRSLDLEHTDVRELKALGTLRELRELDLTETQVQDLQPLSSLPALRTVYVPTGVHEDRVKRLQAQRPKLNVGPKPPLEEMPSSPEAADEDLP